MFSISGMLHHKIGIFIQVAGLPLQQYFICLYRCGKIDPADRQDDGVGVIIEAGRFCAAQGACIEDQVIQAPGIICACTIVSSQADEGRRSEGSPIYAVVVATWLPSTYNMLVPAPSLLR